MTEYQTIDSFIEEFDIEPMQEDSQEYETAQNQEEYVSLVEIFPRYCD